MKDDVLARLWKLEASINNLVLNGRRNPEKVADIFQKIVDEQKPKFALLKDLGLIVVPNDYNHLTQLESFRGKMEKKFDYYAEDINDENFSNPTRILKPGENSMFLL